VSQGGVLGHVSDQLGRRGDAVVEAAVPFTAGGEEVPVVA
jgi:hypothetical protein